MNLIGDSRIPLILLMICAHSQVLRTHLTHKCTARRLGRCRCLCRVGHTLHSKVVNEVGVVVLFFNQFQTLSLEFGYFSLKIGCPEFGLFPYLFLESLVDGFFKFLKILLKIKHHILYKLVQHFKKLPAKQDTHLTFPIQQMFSFSYFFTVLWNQISRVGQSDYTLRFAHDIRSIHLVLIFGDIEDFFNFMPSSFISFLWMFSWKCPWAFEGMCGVLTIGSESVGR